MEGLSLSEQPPIGEFRPIAPIGEFRPIAPPIEECRPIAPLSSPPPNNNNYTRNLSPIVAGFTSTLGHPILSALFPQAQEQQPQEQQPQEEQEPSTSSQPQL